MGNKPDPVSSVRRVDTCSWQNNREDFEAFTFQIRAHLVEYHSPVPINESINILAHDPLGANLSYNAEHFRPKVAGVVGAFSLSGCAKWLAWKAACEDDVIVPPAGSESL